MESPQTPQLVTKSEGKVRILLESVTHLVSGSDREEKLSHKKKYRLSTSLETGLRPEPRAHVPIRRPLRPQEQKMLFS
ncbi:hypothetical protein GGI35DRAFT_436948, partial [Trichoderma velutinum]